MNLTKPYASHRAIWISPSHLIITEPHESHQTIWISPSQANWILRSQLNHPKPYESHRAIWITPNHLNLTESYESPHAIWISPSHMNHTKKWDLWYYCVVRDFDCLRWDDRLTSYQYYVRTSSHQPQKPCMMTSISGGHLMTSITLIIRDDGWWPYNKAINSPTIGGCWATNIPRWNETNEWHGSRHGLQFGQPRPNEIIMRALA